MIVYGIQGKSGRGMYRDEDLKEMVNLTECEDAVLLKDASHTLRQPPPFDTVLDIDSGEVIQQKLVSRTMRRKYHKFGFPSIDAINKWLTHTELYVLAGLGAELIQLEVSGKVYSDDRQVMYDSRKVKGEKMLRLTDIMDYSKVDHEGIRNTVKELSAFYDHLDQLLAQVTCYHH